jgi:hypothetical protein
MEVSRAKTEILKRVQGYFCKYKMHRGLPCKKIVV